MYNKLGLTKNIWLFVLLNTKTDLQHDNAMAAAIITITICKYAINV